MTEKRFSCTDNGFIVDYESEQKVFNLYDVVDLLNEQYEEIQVLKASNGEMEDYLARLEEANRRLQFRTVDMLDYIKSKGAVTHQEMKDWWNNMMTGDDVND